MLKYVTAALVGATLLIGGCNSPTGDTGVVVQPDPRADFVVQYIPTAQNRRAMPYPNDIWKNGSTDGTLNVPGTLASTGAAGVHIPTINRIDGYSTTTPITVPFNFPVDITSIKPYMPIDEAGTPLFGAETNFWVLNVSTGIPLFPLIEGVTDPIAQYEIRVSAATDAQGAVLEIVPLVPLNPDTTYAFVITAGVLDVLGNPLAPDNQFRDIRDACFSGDTLSNAALEAIKNIAVCPILQLAAGSFRLPSQAFMVAWTVSTMSVGDTLAYINENAEAGASVLVPTGVNTNTASGGLLPGLADIVVGTLEVPYYTNPADPTAAWTSADGADLTRLNPIPVPVTNLKIPLFVTIPNGNSAQTKPAEGWPVVLYLPGITSNRATAIAMADGFASQGFAVIGIDLPWHGLRPDHPLAALLLQGPDSPLGANERHFFQDNFTDALAGYASVIPGPDGVVDDGGQVITVGISAPLSLRSVGSQATADLITLARSVPAMDLDADPATQDFDASRMHLVSVSLGSYVAASFMGTHGEIATATLSSPFGNIYGLVDAASQSRYGYLIQSLIVGGTGLQPNTLGFNEFQRDYQHGIDAIDALNYAAAAAMNMPIHAISILNDDAVPNVLTDHWAKVAGLKDISATEVNPEGIRGIVRFTDGGHTSIFDPGSTIDDPVTGLPIQGPNPLVTAEMQQEMISFAVSNGTQLPVNAPLAAAGGAVCDCVQ